LSVRLGPPLIRKRRCAASGSGVTGIRVQRRDSERSVSHYGLHIWCRDAGSEEHDSSRMPEVMKMERLLFRGKGLDRVPHALPFQSEAQVR
jgi:hypothetical protein